MQNFTKLLQNQEWHSHVTILNLIDPVFDHQHFVEITRSFPNLLWLTCNFSQREPEPLLGWIRSWKQNCAHLRVLSLSGIRGSHDDVRNTVLAEMKELDIFEIV